MDAFDFFNIILPASRVEQKINDFNEIINAKNVEVEVSDNILKAELYLVSQQIMPISVSILSKISSIVFGKMYSWAGKLDIRSRTAIDIVISTINTKWDDSLKDDELKIDLMAYGYHSITKLKPFFDGNEVVARLFVNFIGLKYGYNIFEIKPEKTKKIEYSKYIEELKFADKGNLKFLRERIKNNIKKNFENIGLGPSAYVTD